MQVSNGYVCSVDEQDSIETMFLGPCFAENHWRMLDQEPKDASVLR